MSIEKEVNKAVEVIAAMKTRNAFDKNITRMVFPYFKNYSYFSEINFDFPLTVLVGKNGTGKSSALHALYGAPLGNNITDFWFSTDIDPIEEFGEENERHTFFYEYEENRIKKEVLYQRRFHARRKKKLEYWETSRPRKKYKMRNYKDRYRPIEKELLHLDFRSELSAFDKHFYFGSVEHLKSLTKQDYLRNRSRPLKNVIETGEIIQIRTKTQNDKVIELTPEELKMITFILEEEYTGGQIIHHKLFGDWGHSVILNKDNFKYSEAQAGSGEIAVVMLVHRILNANPGSLILLDEPEVSLHPGAQKNLMLMLMNQIKINKHQVIMATHSPVFTEGLPKQAIKRFVKNVENGKTDIYDECYPSEAFKHLGLSSKYDGALIHVEDDLMIRILTALMNEQGDRFEGLATYSTPGGASNIISKSIVDYSRDVKNNKFVYLDGDQYTDVQIPDTEDLTERQKTKSHLSGVIKELTNVDVQFVKDGGNGSTRDDQIVEAQLAYLKYYKKYVKFLPVLTPEHLIWDQEAVEQLLINSEDKEIKALEDIENPKDKIYYSSKLLLGDEEPVEVKSLEKILIKNWLKKNDRQKQIILESLEEFMNLLNS